MSSIDVGLRQQIHALEEADIISNEAASKESQIGADTSVGTSTGWPAAAGKPPITSRTAIIGGGLGNLDVGWLNSRNDNVGKEMEAELWKEASSFLAGLEESKVVGRDNDERNVTNNR